MNVITASGLVRTCATAPFPRLGAEGDSSQGDMIVWDGPGGDGAGDAVRRGDRGGADRGRDRWVGDEWGDDPGSPDPGGADPGGADPGGADPGGAARVGDDPSADGSANVDPLGSFAVRGEEDGEAPDWQERALCAQTDPEAFFPEKGGSTREAKRICSGCEVRAECLEYALVHDERFGIWGGLSERERRRLRQVG